MITDHIDKPRVAVAGLVDTRYRLVGKNCGVWSTCRNQPMGNIMFGIFAGQFRQMTPEANPLPERQKPWMSKCFLKLRLADQKNGQHVSTARLVGEKTYLLKQFHRKNLRFIDYQQHLFMILVTLGEQP